MSEQTLFEKLGVQYREKDGILYPLITVEIKEEDVVCSYIDTEKIIYYKATCY